MAVENTFDVVVRLLERQLRDAENNLKLGRQNNAPDIEALEKAVVDAQKSVEKYRASRGQDRRRLTDKYLGDYYDNVGDWVRDLVQQNPALITLFSKAVSNNWSTEKFIGEIYKSDWWKEQKDKGRGNRWLEAFIMENDPANQGKWLDSIEAVKQKIRDLADSVYNMQVDEGELDKIARRYLYQGWDLADERGLKVWLARQFGKRTEAGDEALTPGGLVLDYERQLNDAARNFGLFRPNDWAAKTAASILDPESGLTEDDAWNDLIAEAESLYPAFAGKLAKDRSVRDVAAGYIGQLARYLEINDPEMIDLQDPLLQKAFTNLDQNSNPALMPLWQFTQEIKKDGRWQYTTNALDTYSRIGSDLSRMMGFVG
jgi:hypothetical protein